MSQLNVDRLNIGSNLRLPQYTTAQRDALRGVVTGDLIYNTSDEQVQGWDGTKWKGASQGGSVSATGGTITTSGGSGIASDGDVDIDGDLTIKDGSTPKIGLYQSSGNIVAVGDITTNGSVSDERLKENVVRINNAIDKVSQINGYTFNYKDRPDETLPGVLAQEIEKVLPEVVYEFEQEHEENSEHYKAVRYAHIVPLLIEAIKDLKGKVDDLQDQINKS